jgi:hypothetical protein
MGPEAGTLAAWLKPRLFEAGLNEAAMALAAIHRCSCDVTSVFDVSRVCAAVWRGKTYRRKSALMAVEEDFARTPMSM